MPPKGTIINGVSVRPLPGNINNGVDVDDFEPAAVVNQVEPLRNLMETRNKLRDLMTKIDRSEELENVLEEVLSNTASLDSIAKELKVEESEK